MRGPGVVGLVGSEAVGFEGVEPQSTPNARPRMRLDPLCNFVFLAHPFRWDVFLTEEGAKLLPRLRAFYFEPGVSGVEQVRGKDENGAEITDGNPVRALAQLRQSGWIEIDPKMEITAFGKKRRGYAVRYNDGYKGPVHLSAWHKPYALGGRVEVDFDEAGWHAFLQGLLDSGVVPPPTRATQQALRIKLERAMRRRAARATTHPGARAATEIYEQKLEAVKRPTAVRPPPAPPAPRLGGRGRRGTPAEPPNPDPADDGEES